MDGKKESSRCKACDWLLNVTIVDWLLVIVDWKLETGN